MRPVPISLVWLFDVDGTLLLTRGAGRDALVLALRDELGVDDDLRDIPFAGRTDRLIVQDIATKHGLELRDGALERLWTRVAAHMSRLMDPPRGGLLPGAAALIDAVSGEPGWVNALLTGNESSMARIKLESFGLWDRFSWGAFGEEAPDRDALALLAVQRAMEKHGMPPARCIVVGDTEHDVACARVAGARAVAVASGSRHRNTLEGCGPDLLLDDLRDMATLFEWARGLVEPGSR